MNKNKVNLHALPARVKYPIALAVIALVVAAARLVGGHRPAPEWLTRELIPVLGWVYLALCLYLIVYHVARRIARRKR